MQIKARPPGPGAAGARPAGGPTRLRAIYICILESDFVCDVVKSLRVYLRVK